MVQACRSNEQQQDGTGDGSGPSRPRTPVRLRISADSGGAINSHDYIRVMAAAKDESAYRNLFLPLIIEQLTNGKDLLAAVVETRQYMMQQGRFSSTVTLEATTMDKILHLVSK